MPQRRALESVSSAASARRAAIRRHASSTVVLSGTVSAFDSRSRLTVRSPPPPPPTPMPPIVLREFHDKNNVACIRRRSTQPNSSSYIDRESPGSMEPAPPAAAVGRRGREPLPIDIVRRGGDDRRPAIAMVRASPSSLAN